MPNTALSRHSSVSSLRLLLLLLQEHAARTAGMGEALACTGMPVQRACFTSRPHLSRCRPPCPRLRLPCLQPWLLQQQWGLSLLMWMPRS